MKKYLFGFIGIVAAVAAFASVPPGTVGGDDVNPRTRLVTNAWENAKGDIMAAMTDGEARPLPRYLHALTFFDAYPAEAAAYYATLAEVGGGCSAVRDGNTFARNFDFPFDDRAEFVITMQPGAGRFASVGVANVGTNLTEAMVNSGKPENSAKYKWLPGATTDGVNENGVAACINVVSSFGHTNGWHGATVHYLAAVRRVLDTATNAADAAADLAANVYVPQSALDRGYSFHYIIADRTATYIVEDGEARPYTGRVVMTNYRLFDPGEPYGTGRERAALLADPDADITEAWFTLAYEADTRPIRYSEFVAPGKNPTNEYDNAVASWANGARETHRGKGFWQSVHTSIYDLENLTLKIAVQEIPDFYTFAIPQGGGIKPEAVKEIVEPMIGTATNGLRRVDDMEVYRNVTNTMWVWSNASNQSLLDAILSSENRNMAWNGPSPDFGVWSAPSFGQWYPNTLIEGKKSRRSFPQLGYHNEYGDVATVDCNGLDYQHYSKTTDRIATTNGVNAAIASKRDLTYNTCHKTEFTEWTNDIGPEWKVVDVQLYPGAPHFWQLKYNVSDYGSSEIKTWHEDDVSLTWRSNTDWDKDFDITFTRSAVCASNELFVTSSYVTNAVEKSTKDFITSSVVTNIVNDRVSANLNTYIDGETGVEYVGKYYGGNLYYVPTGNVYPPNN